MSFIADTLFLRYVKILHVITRYIYLYKRNRSKKDNNEVTLWGGNNRKCIFCLLEMLVQVGEGLVLI